MESDSDSFQPFRLKCFCTLMLIGIYYFSFCLFLFSFIYYFSPLDLPISFWILECMAPSLRLNIDISSFMLLFS